MSSASIFLWSAWVVAALGIGLMLWATIGDRSRGRRRCPRCWYSMPEEPPPSSAPSAATKPATNAASSSRARRCSAGSSLVCCSSPAGWPIRVWPRASTDGWLSVVPLRVVVELAPPREQQRTARHRNWQKRAQESQPRAPDAVAAGSNRAGADVHPPPLHCRQLAGHARSTVAGERRTEWLLQNRNTPLYEQVSAGPLTAKDGTPADEELADLVASQTKLPCVLTCRTRPVWPEGAAST